MEFFPIFCIILIMIGLIIGYFIGAAFGATIVIVPHNVVMKHWCSSEVYYKSHPVLCERYLK